MICPLCGNDRPEWNYICLDCTNTFHRYNISFLRFAYTYRCSIINGHTNVHFSVHNFIEADGRTWNFSNILSHPIVAERRKGISPPGGTNPQKQSDWNTTCNICGSPAYQGFTKIECSNKHCK